MVDKSINPRLIRNVARIGWIALFGCKTISSHFTVAANLCFITRKDNEIDKIYVTNEITCPWK